MKKILLMIMMLTLCGFGICEARDVELEATAEVIIQTDREYEFDFMGLSDIKMELKSTTALVGVNVGIGKLTLNPKVGVWDSEMEIAELVTLENSAGLALGLGAEYLIASPEITEETVLDISLVADYMFGDSEVDDIKINNISVPLAQKNDINRHDLFVGVKTSYNGLPLDGVLSLAMGYSRSEIDLGASLGMLSPSIVDVGLDMESSGFSIRPGLSIEPIEDLTINLEGRFVDQIAGVVSCSYKF